jgi:hypothetical protein
MTKEQKLLLGVGLVGVTAYLLFKKKKKNFLNFTQTELDIKCPRSANWRDLGYADAKGCCDAQGGIYDYVNRRCLANKSADQVICENNGDTWNQTNNQCIPSEAHQLCNQKDWTFEFVNGVCRQKQAVTDCLTLGRIPTRDNYDGSTICTQTQDEKDCNANADVWTKASNERVFSCVKSQAHLDCDANGDLWENGICKPSASHTNCDTNKDNWENGVCNQSVQHTDCTSSGGTYINGVCTTKKKNYIPYIVGGVVLASVLILKQK